MSLSISKNILAWYSNNKRTLPWRNYKNQKDRHYKVLLSEFMLQQTQVKTALPYFNNFYSNINSINKLAVTSQKKVNKLWEGLGYYRRARFLLESAKIIAQKYNGKLPDNYEDLIKLPGVGDYTAKAILSIGFDKSEIGIDGNVERVTSRVFGKHSKKEIAKNVQKLKVKKRSSDLMQGLMELGALVCKPSKPHCNDCCINQFCSFNLKEAKSQKIKKIKEKKIKKFITLILIKKNKILVTKNQNIGILKNFYCTPLFEYKTENNLVLKLKKELGKNLIIKPSSILKINISNYVAQIKILDVTLNNKLKKNYRMLSRSDLKKEFISSFFLKILKKVNFI